MQHENKDVEIGIRERLHLRWPIDEPPQRARIRDNSNE